MATKDINDACFALRDKWEEIKIGFFQRSPNKYLVLSAVFRSSEEQFELFKRGRAQDENGNWIVVDQSQVVTNVDGYKTLGAHNYWPSRAIDVAVVDNQTGKTLWEESCYYPLVEIARGVGLESGGEWKSLKDYPHIQVRDFRNYKE